MVYIRNIKAFPIQYQEIFCVTHNVEYNSINYFWVYEYIALCAAVSVVTI